MFSFVYLLLAVAIVAEAKEMNVARSMRIADLINSTVCAMERKIDVDDNRIPRKILILKCAQETNKWCKHNGLPENECCHSVRNHLLTECMEITELVYVIYKDRNETARLDVSMGCACVMTHSTQAPPVEGLWPYRRAHP